MSTSNQFSFNPGLGSLALSAYARCGVRRTSLTSQHMDDAYMEANLLQADLVADGIIWWTVELVQQPLTAGAASYGVPSNTVSVLDVYVAPNGGQSGQNRIITAFSRTDYASLADPTQTGFPTSFWFNRALTPTLTLWPVPDDSTNYLMSYYVYTQPDDAVLQDGKQVAVPYWWMDAYVAGLAYRLARIYAPALEAQRKQDWLDAYQKACEQVEPAPLYITPGLTGYYRSGR